MLFYFTFNFNSSYFIILFQDTNTLNSVLQIYMNKNVQISDCNSRPPP